MAGEIGMRVTRTNPEGGNPDDLQFSVRLEAYDVDTGQAVGHPVDLTLSAGGLGNDPAAIKAAVEKYATDQIAGFMTLKSAELDVLKPVFDELATVDVRLTKEQAADRIDAIAVEMLEAEAKP